MGAAGFGARDKKIEKCFGELGQEFGALVAVGHNQQGPFGGLPDQDQIERLGRGRQSGERQRAGFAAHQLGEHFLKGLMAAEGVEQIADGGMRHGRARTWGCRASSSFSMLVVENPGSSGKQHDLAAGGFHFFAPGDEMRPIRALDQNVGQDIGDELARRVFVEEGDGVDGVERASHARPFLFGDQRPRGTFETGHAGVGVERENQDVAERPRPFQQADVAGMKKVVTTVGEDDGLAGAAPECARLDQFRTSIKGSHVRIPLLSYAGLV